MRSDIRISRFTALQHKEQKAFEFPLPVSILLELAMLNFNIIGKTFEFYCAGGCREIIYKVPASWQRASRQGPGGL